MIKSRRHLYSILKINKPHLDSILGNLDKYYYENKKLKKDKNGNPRKDLNGNFDYRILYPSKGELKVIQRRIKDRILNQLELPDFVQGGVKGKSNISNAMIHKGNKYFFLTDLKKFFPSIRHFQIYKMLISNEFSPTIASIITKLTTYNKILPQGTPTSTVLANLTFCVVDAELSTICKENNLTFTRFVDDITISSKVPFKNLSNQLVTTITTNGYSISRKKTAYKIGPTNVTGVLVRNNTLSATKEFHKTLKSTIKESSIAGKLLYKKRVEKFGKQKRKSVINNGK